MALSAMPTVRGRTAGILAGALVAALLAAEPARAAATAGGAAPAEPQRAEVLATTSVDEMPPKMREAYIRGIQEELAAHGYDAGPVTGTVTPELVHAVREYQQDAGLPPSGEVTKELLDHLKFALPKVTRAARSAPVAGPTPPPGTRDYVRVVQAELDARGYAPGPIDGLVGPRTRAAVKRFQTDAGLEVTGNLHERLLEQIRAAAVTARR